MPRVFQSPLLWILLMGFLSMGGALRADYYMDDYGFILNSKGDGPSTFRWQWMGKSYGSTALDAMGTSLFQLLPTLMTIVSNTLFPQNPMGAHLWNLSIHLCLAVLVFRLGGRLLAQLGVLPSAASRRQAAFLGALIFACHPLGTEPVHYAKCHMVQLVALFGFWATCEALQFLKCPTGRQGLRLTLIMVLCVVSYYPGTVLMGFNLGLLFLFFLRGKTKGYYNRYLPSDAVMAGRPARLLIGVACAVILFTAWTFAFFFYKALTNLGDLYPTHVLTQGRVFWEYAQRLVLPVHLASDHYQPWSTFADMSAVFRLTGFALMGIGALWLALGKHSRSSRALGLLLCFVLIPFAMRMLYMNMEIMVEYRAYHALPWVGLLAGWGLTALALRFQSRPSPISKIRWVPAGVLVAAFTLLSAERSKVWRSGTLLAENVLSQYPLNNRARTQLQSFDLDAGQYPAVLERHAEILMVRDQIEALNATTAGRTIIDPNRANVSVIGSYQFAVLARAEMEGCIKALAFADQSIASLQTRLPSYFRKKDAGDTVDAWPLLEARAAVERAKAAGYGAPVP